MPTQDSPTVALRRERLRWWIDNRCDGSQANFIALTRINQGELSGLLRSKSFGEKRAASLEVAAGMPSGFLVNPMTGYEWRSFSGLSAEPSATHPPALDDSVDDGRGRSEFEPERTRGQEISRGEPAPGYVRFELLDGVGGMGLGVANEDYPEVLREVDVAEWEVRRKLGFMPRPGRVRMMTGRGPSMRPKIDHGEVVFVDSSVTSFDGDAIYVININGETQIKILQMRQDGLYVVSANDAYPPYRIDDPDGLFIGGRVLSVLGMREL